MAYYRQVGEVPPKRHTQHRTARRRPLLRGADGGGGLLLGLVAALPPRRPVGDRRRDAVGAARPGTTPNHPLLPRHLRLHDLFPGEDWKAVDAVTGRRLVLGNADVRISYVVAGEASPLYRNAIGDECVYVESGAGHRRDGVRRARRAAGRLRAAAPRHHAPLGAGGRGTAAALRDRGEQAHRAAEALPVALRAAPGARPVLRARPARPGRAAARRGRPTWRCWSSTAAPAAASRAPATSYPTHPFDVVGWDGCLYPYTFNVADFEPITGRVHQPPPVHQVFEGERTS